MASGFPGRVVTISKAKAPYEREEVSAVVWAFPMIDNTITQTIRAQVDQIMEALFVVCGNCDPDCRT